MRDKQKRLKCNWKKRERERERNSEKKLPRQTEERLREGLFGVE